MATGDPIAVEIVGEAPHFDGWVVDVTIEGWAAATGVSLANGYTGNNIPTAPKLSGTATSTSRTAVGGDTTIERSFAAVIIAKKLYPDDADDHLTVSGSDLKVRLVLNRVIYQGDTATVAILAGLLTSSLGSSNAYSGSVTNSSTRAYPAIWLKWARGKSYDLRKACGSTCTIGVHVRAGRRGIAASLIGGCSGVRGTATGVTSSVIATASSTTHVERVFDEGSGIFYDVYELTFDLSGHTQGEQVNIDAIAEPRVGDTPFNTADHSADDKALNWGTEQVTCNKTGALTVYGAVDGVGGSPATSTSEATARTTPYATIAAALNAGATVVVLEAASHAVWGAAVTSSANSFWKIIRPATGVTRAQAILAFTSTASNHQYKTNYLCLQNLTLQGLGSASYLDGETARTIWLDRCKTTKGTGTLTAPMAYRSVVFFTTECDFDDLYWWQFGLSFATSRLACIDFGSLSANSAGYTARQFYTLFGHRNVGIGFEVSLLPAGTGAPAPAGFLHDYNERIKHSHTAKALLSSETLEIPTGISNQCNIIEANNNITGALVQIAGDSSSVDQDNVLDCHNTIMGQRSNLGYQEHSFSDPSTPDADYRSRDDWESIGTSRNDWNNKGGDFGSVHTLTLTTVEDNGGKARFVLSGAPSNLAANQWVKVTGTAGYNGWHQLAAASPVSGSKVTTQTAYGSPESSLTGTMDARSGTRSGNLQVLYGVDRHSSRVEVSSAFPPRWGGEDYLVDSLADVVDPQSYWNGSTYSADAGGGDYTPTDGGNLDGSLMYRALSHDLRGTAIAESGGCIGAIQRLAASIAVTIDGDSAAEDATVQLAAGNHTIRVTASGGTVEVSSVTLGGSVGGTLTGLFDTITNGDYREATLEVSGDGTVIILSDAGDGSYGINIELELAGGRRRGRYRRGRMRRAG